MGITHSTGKNYAICRTANLRISYASHNKHLPLSEITLSDLSLEWRRPMFREVCN
jgi:hypothetical protein